MSYEFEFNRLTRTPDGRAVFGVVVRGVELGFAIRTENGGARYDAYATSDAEWVGRAATRKAAAGLIVEALQGSTTGRELLQAAGLK